MTGREVLAVCPDVVSTTGPGFCILGTVACHERLAASSGVRLLDGSTGAYLPSEGPDTWRGRLLTRFACTSGYCRYSLVHRDRYNHTGAALGDSNATTAMPVARMRILSLVVTTCCGISCHTFKGPTTDSAEIATQETLIPQADAIGDVLTRMSSRVTPSLTMPSKPGNAKGPRAMPRASAVSKNN
jgi:hypothetical protein